MGDETELVDPFGVGAVHSELAQHDLGDTVEHGGFVRDMPVEHRRVPLERLAEAAHGQSALTVAVKDRQRGLQDQGVRDRASLGSAPTAGRQAPSGASSVPSVRPVIDVISVPVHMLTEHCRPTLWANGVDTATNWVCTEDPPNQRHQMLVVVGLIVLLVAVIVGIVGVLSNAGPTHRYGELLGLRLSRHRIHRNALSVRDRRRSGGPAGSERAAGRCPSHSLPRPRRPPPARPV